MHPSRALPVLLLASVVAPLLVGCGSAGSTASSRPAERILAQGDEGFIRTIETSGARTDTVAVAPTVAMRALIATIEELGIEVTLVNPTKGEVGNPRFVALRRLAGEPLSRYVSCGQTVTGLRADNDRLTFNILAVVEPLASGGSSVVTRMEATAQDMQSGNSAQTMQCTSTGVLETRIVEGMRRRTGG